MKEVLDFIETKKQEYAQLPLFEFMRNANIEPKQRLIFAPSVAHFIMNFSDLNKYVFREEPPQNKIQELINKHTYEDDHHWMWFLEDLEKLGFNRSMGFVDTLQFLWSKETNVTRQLSYKISGYTLQADPILKLAVIEAIEATGNVLFYHTTQVALELEKVTNQEYRYFGSFHFALENGHAASTDEVEKMIETIQLTEETSKKAMELVEQVFEIFTAWTNELMAYAQKHENEQQLVLFEGVEGKAIANDSKKQQQLVLSA